MRSYRRDPSVVDRPLAPGTRRRILGYATPYRRQIAVFLTLVVVDAGWDPDRARDDVVSRVDPSVAQVRLGDDLKPPRQDLLSRCDVRIAIRQHRIVEERDG